MAQLPEKIGKYTITGIAGEGAMGVVYVGHDPFVDRKVAIKVRHEEDHVNDRKTVKSQLRMFFNEAQTAGALDHPNILKVYDAGEADSQPYIVTEYVENARTLKSHCVMANMLPADTVLKVVMQCAEALDYAHTKGVTHRDIKPSNIMINERGDIKIVDFGIAQRTECDRTQVLGWFGSPLYMSPEQARDEQVGSQTDLFSLGVVMYELLTAQRPFVANGISALIQQILTKDPKPLTELKPALPGSVGAIIKHALEKDPAKRYKTGAEMAADLRKALIDVTQPQLNPEQRFAAARALAFFTEFSDIELGEFMKTAAWESCPKGTTVIEEGDDGLAFYIIISGEVSIRRAGKEIATLGPGECFGEMAYLGEGKRSASVCTTEETRTMKISAPLRQWASLSVQMRLTRVFQRTLIDRLGAANRKLAKILA
jgi:eukaryotic-like serine/threonine-protein kinase